MRRHRLVAAPRIRTRGARSTAYQAFRHGLLGALVGLPLLALSPQAQVRQEEKVDYYRRWVDREVVYIITAEERDVFSKLTTSVEKDRFIEQFWQRRDPNFRTAVNEFKEEHYRRLAYANENFRSGIDGWATDRGQIYIRFGEPDSIERHPTGGRYDRPLAEGGGSTTTFPFEVWTYNYVEDLRRLLTIEFVDPLGSGEYRIALHDSEKDALLYVSGQGKTLAETAGLETRAGRVRNALHLRGIGLEGDSPLRESDNPFALIEHYFDLRRPQEFRFPELREVTSRVFYDTLPVRLRVHRRWIDPAKALVAVTLYVPAAEVAYGEGQTAGVNLDLYGAVQTLSGSIDYEFEDELAIPDPRKVREFVYQKKIPLRPGRYKVTMVVRDRHSDRLGTPITSVWVPESSLFGLSDVVLTDRVVAMRGEEGLNEPFTTRMGLKVYPLSGNVVSGGRRLAFFFEIYNFSTDSATGQPAVEWSYAVVPEGASWEETEFITGGSSGRYQDALAVAQFVATADLAPGPYLLRIQAEDRISEKSARAQHRFEVVDH